MPLGERIEPIKPGGMRTFLSAALGNACISVLNAVLKMRGEQGIKVSMADAGICVSIEETYKKKLDTVIEGGGGGGGSISFMGEWAPGTYAINDVVIRSTTTTQDDAKSGTFISTANGNTDEPPSGETMDSTKWKTVARGHWKRLKVRDPSDSNLGSTVIEGANILVDFGPDTVSGGNNTKLDLTSIPAGAYGKTFSPRLILVCDGGVEKSMYVLGTAAF